MSFFFHSVIYQPIYNLLVLIYNWVPFSDFGVAIIILTILVKLVLFPLSKKQIESQKKMQEIQPMIKEIQNKHKNDKEKQSRALMELYKSNKTNPFSGCLPLVAQLVFLIAIYRVLFNISQNNLVIDGSILYSFINNPGQINSMFLGIINLSSGLDFKQVTISSAPHIILVLFAAGAQFIQSKMMMTKPTNGAAKEKDNDFTKIMSKQMLYMGPALTLFIGFKFPAGLALYWLVSTVFMIFQQRLLEKKADQK